MDKRSNARRRAWAVIFRPGKKVVEDLPAELASGNTRVFWKAGRCGRDVVHPPVRKGCSGVVRSHDETSRTRRTVAPRQLRRLIATGAAIDRAGVGAIGGNIVDHADGKSCVVR